MNLVILFESETIGNSGESGNLKFFRKLCDSLIASLNFFFSLAELLLFLLSFNIEPFFQILKTGIIVMRLI